MEYEPKDAPPWNTNDRKSFAHASARDRWPIILTNAIDDTHRAVAACDATQVDKIEEGKRIVEKIATLKYEMQHDRLLTPLDDDGGKDIKGYNAELQALGPPKWFDVPWLFSECYMYRRIHTLFSKSTHWKNYDIFAKQKISTFRSSRAGVLELATRYQELVTQLSSKSTEEIEVSEELLFIEMCEICLWGNATDLSLLTTLTMDDIQKLQGADARKAAEENVLINDLKGAYETLKKARSERPKEDRRVEIVLDNAGFELFVDIILAGYLLASNLATHVVLHPKSLPWFVSDVLPADFAELLNALADPQKFYTTQSDDDKHIDRHPESLSEKEVQELEFLFKHWSGFHSEGQLMLRPNDFWTQGGSFWRLPALAPRLLEDFKESALVIFKGDLNYRKLTADVAWEPTKPFKDALGPLGANSGVRVLALRTCKGDEIVGLPTGLDEKLRATEGGGGEDGGRQWAWIGKWAVMQFSDGV